MKKVILALLIFMGCPAVFAGQSISTFIGNYHGTGLEVAIPYVRDIDKNGDGVADLLAVRYIVYPVGSKVPVFTGSQSVFPYPSLTCPVPLVVQYLDEYRRGSKAALDTNLVFHAPGDRLLMTLNLYAYCPSTQKLAVSSAIHSAKLGGTTVVSDRKWKRYFPGWELFGANGVDTNGDNLNNVLAVELAKDGPSGATVAQLLMLNKANGKAVTAVRTYPVYKP